MTFRPPGSEESIVWLAFEHARSSPSTNTGLGTTLEWRSPTDGTYQRQVERPPHIEVGKERAGPLQNPEEVVGLGDDVMDVGVPREGASDGDSEIFFLSNSRRVYAIKVVTVTQGLALSRNTYCFALGRVEVNVVHFTPMFHV